MYEYERPFPKAAEDHVASLLEQARVAVADIVRHSLLPTLTLIVFYLILTRVLNQHYQITQVWVYILGGLAVGSARSIIRATRKEPVVLW